MLSLRGKLVASTILAGTVVLLAAGLAVYALVRTALVEQIDDSLIGRARLLAGAVEQEGGRLELDFDEFDMREFESADGPAYLQLRHEGGAVVYRSPSLRGGDLEQTGAPPDTPTCRWLTLPNGRRARAMEMLFRPRVEGNGNARAATRARLARLPKPVKAAIVAEAGDNEIAEIETETEGGKTVYEAQWDTDGRKAEIKVSAEGKVLEKQVLPRRRRTGRTPRRPRETKPKAVSLILARDASGLEGTLASLRAVLLAVGAAAIAVSSGVLWLVVWRGLAPVKQVADRIRQVRPDSLGDKLETHRAPKELQPVVARLNELLGRLAAAFDRERSFTADVAHELRTPLAGLRSTMEVALSRRRPPGEYAEAIDECCRIVVQLQAMVENLLFLARLEAGRAEIDPQPIRLADLAEDVWEPLKRHAQARRLHVRWKRDASQSVRTDPTLARLIVHNLLDNAVAYADEGGTVEVEASGDDAAARFRVSNTGSRISQEQAERAFDRFWRDDSVRTAAGVHCGLGLSLVRRAASALGGAVEVNSRVGGHFEISVRLPDLADADAA